MNDAGHTAGLRRNIIIASAIFFIEAFVLNGFVIALLVGLAVVFWMLPRSLLAFRNREVMKARLASTGVYALMVAAVLAASNLNNRLAARRADALVAACNAYHAAEGRYPRKLEDLVPRFINHVPRAKLAMMNSDFTYFASEEGERESHWLLYVVLPPFGRRTYDFERQAWGILD